MKEEKIRKDLLDQLERNGVTGEYFTDLVDKYIEMWGTSKALQEDIELRGISVKYQNGKDQWGYRKNDSVDQQIKVNAQMLKILAYLEIKPSLQDGDEDDEEM